MNSVILSQQASRFWIPFDVKLFESNCFNFLLIIRKKKNQIIVLALTPIEYLEKYCRVNTRRHTLYKRVFDKHKDSEGELSVKVRIESTTVRCLNNIQNVFCNYL